VEDLGSEREAAFRQRLGVASSGRKYGVAPRSEEEEAVDLDLRAAIARGIRGPLTRATGLVLSLQGAVGSAEDRDVLRQLTNSLRRLDRLTADLHDVERIADGTLPINRRRTDLAALVETTVAETDRLEDRLVRVDADRVHASVDPDRVRQIVEGMLDAARERTRSGAAIVVRVRDADAGARISVEDDNRTPAGIGPELSLAMHLAALHGTEIIPDGSSFRVVFPRDDGI
jgi:signal transduction histidine kinase